MLNKFSGCPLVCGSCCDSLTVGYLWKVCCVGLNHQDLWNNPDGKMSHVVSPVFNHFDSSNYCIKASQIIIIFNLSSSPERFFSWISFLPLLRYFMVPTLTSSGSRGTLACMSSDFLTRIRLAELWTWLDILSTTCWHTSATWAQTNATSWPTGGFGMETDT